MRRSAEKRLIKRFSLLKKTIIRLLLIPLAAGSGFILMLFLSDVVIPEVIPHSVKASFYRLPESCGEILFGMGTGTLPGIVFWLTRNIGRDIQKKDEM